MIRFAGSQKGYGIGIGRVKLTAIIDGEKRQQFLNDVLHAPGLRRKLLSLNAAVNKGCRGEFANNKIIIR